MPVTAAGLAMAAAWTDTVGPTAEPNAMATADITLYHNPACGTSRAVLGLIREAGFEPRVIPYLDDPPDRPTLLAMIAATGRPVRDLLRTKAPAYVELGLDDPAVGDAALVDAMLAHPILINRPIVVTPLGTRLCRPAETVHELLPAAP